MYVIGTAGHVDHGKSTLVQALTGIDPDRLAEEKARGMTIDLGFAWLKLPSGQEISIVDVPGHERFIKNMLAGVGGIDVALLVVAADEGPMPQTDEHLAILDLLGITRGAVAITKVDLVDEEWLELVTAEIEERLTPTSLAGAPLVPVSAVTGEGLQELTATLDELLTSVPPRQAVGKPRVPVDRVFTIAGFGTVVTGTLIDGELRVGQEMELMPSGKKTRIRGIQSHKRKVDSAGPGSRVAVNLVSLATEEIQRGDVLTTPGWMRPTRAVDVKLRATRDAPKALEHGDALTFHTGASERVAKLALLDVQKLEPGESGWAQLRLEEPVALARGDQFIVRVPSPSFTVGGGTVVDAHPKRHRRFQEALLESLDTLEKGTPEEILLQQLPAGTPMDLQSLVRRTGLSQEQVREAATRLLTEGQALLLDGAKGEGSLNSQSLLISAGAWSNLKEQVASMLAAYHAEFPLRKGIPREEVRSRGGLEARAFSRVEARLLAEGVVREFGPLMALADHEVRFSAELRRRVDEMQSALREAGTSPPSTAALIDRFGLDTEVLAALLDQGTLVEVAPEMVMDKQIYLEMVETIVAMLREQGSITVAAVRDRFGTSRKYSLAIMEHLDEKRVTRRVGDERVLA